MVNQVHNEKELAALHRARDHGQPYGQDRWVQKTASAPGIESSLRPPGRPKKADAGERTAYDPFCSSPRSKSMSRSRSVQHSMTRIPVP
jgi:hypothetical protein